MHAGDVQRQLTTHCSTNKRVKAESWKLEEVFDATGCPSQKVRDQKILSDDEESTYLHLSRYYSLWQISIVARRKNVGFASSTSNSDGNRIVVRIISPKEAEASSPSLSVATAVDSPNNEDHQAVNRRQQEILQPSKLHQMCATPLLSAGVLLQMKDFVIVSH